jgi:hypothetical protein
MARLKIQCCGDVIERLIEIAHKVVNCSALVPAFGKVGGDRDNPIESFEGGAPRGNAHGSPVTDKRGPMDQSFAGPGIAFAR